MRRLDARNIQRRRKRLRFRLVLVAILVSIIGLMAGGCAGSRQAGTQFPQRYAIPGGVMDAATPALARAKPARLPVSDEEKWIVHVLNRLGYGPRPGDVERVRQMGLTNYIALQLAPERIPDPAVEAKLQPLRTLAMSTQELYEAFPQPKAKERREDQQGRGEGGPSEKPAKPLIFAALDAGPGQERRGKQEPPNLSGFRQGEAVGRRRQLMAPRDQDIGRMMDRMEDRPAAIAIELSQAKVLRAIYSERQLQEVMADFWYNHFNVFAPKGADRWLVTSYDRDVIRPYALGRFRDLLRATAKHPAMLFYLDNWMSSKPGGPDGLLGRPAAQANRGRFTGLNENYARELMELHTLGVDGGYTQKDVTEVARCFTGWSIERLEQGGGFVFGARMHDTGEKVVLGVRIPAGGGIEDGERVLDLLARHPSTARFIGTKLVRRFVADTPPPALVERVARAFLQSDGDIRTVVRTIVTSPEFFSDQAYRAKVKKPLELVVSAVRALGADAEAYSVLPMAVGRIGEPLFQSQPPTGYPDTAEAWVNTGALLNRMNFGLSLASGRIPGIRVDLDRVVGPPDPQRPEQAMDRLVASLLHNDVSEATKRTLMAQLAAPENTRSVLGDGENNTRVAALAGLILGSPEFQRR